MPDWRSLMKAHFHWIQAVWDASTLTDGVTFSLLSPDGDERFPGAVQAQVSYRLTADNSLLVAMRGVTSKSTPINVFSHYFMNLAGHVSRKPETSVRWEKSCDNCERKNSESWPSSFE